MDHYVLLLHGLYLVFLDHCGYYPLFLVFITSMMLIMYVFMYIYICILTLMMMMMTTMGSNPLPGPPSGQSPRSNPPTPGRWKKGVINVMAHVIVLFFSNNNSSNY